MNFNRFSDLTKRKTIKNISCPTSARSFEHTIIFNLKINGNRIFAKKLCCRPDHPRRGPSSAPRRRPRPGRSSSPTFSSLGRSARGALALHAHARLAAQLCRCGKVPRSPPRREMHRHSTLGSGRSLLARARGRNSATTPRAKTWH